MAATKRASTKARAAAAAERQRKSKSVIEANGNHLTEQDDVGLIADVVLGLEQQIRRVEIMMQANRQELADPMPDLPMTYGEKIDKVRDGIESVKENNLDVWPQVEAFMDGRKHGQG